MPFADKEVGRAARATAWLPARVLRAAAALAVLAAGACAPALNEAPRPGESLGNHLPVAEAALAAGQPAVARRLYRSLAERFDDAPEPALGLAYIAFHSGDFAAAERHFLMAVELAEALPAVKAEALLGAGRAALAQGRTGLARQRFEDAEEPGRGTPASPWIANGLAVAAALDGDYGTAEAHAVEALRRSSGHPRIAANLVRMLVVAGRVDAAARAYAERDPASWRDDDGGALARLIEAARREGPVPGTGVALRLSRADPSWPRGGAPAGAGLPRTSGLLLRVAARAPAAPAAPAGRNTRADRAAPTTLSLILGQSQRLRLDGDATTVLVASPEIADVQLLSPNLLYVIGKAVGRTSVVVHGDGNWIGEHVVRVAPDLEPLRAILAREPDLRDVHARRLLRGVMLTGEVASAAAADRALRIAQAALPEGLVVENELRIADSQQVNLEVQIAEVQRSIAEDLGINWQAFQGDFGFRVGEVSAVVPNLVRPKLIEGTAASSLFYGTRWEDGRIVGVIDALARAGLANVLARPNVTAVSGKTASFFSGGEYPLPTGFEEGALAFKYKKYGVLLDFVPTVIDAGRIALTVRPEVSEPSLTDSVQVVGVDIPVINVRRAETTVEVRDGESIVIAGLFRNASNTVEAGVPWLKDLPGLGLLFGRTSVRSDELELIVVVTARLVRPVAVRTDGDAAPSRRAGGFHY